MSRRHVIVVGGGLAGLAAALECQDAGHRVTVLESRPRLGGATWSFRRNGYTFDNGQHVFMRCCTAYRRFLRRLGVEDRVRLQKRLSVPVLSPHRRPLRIERAPLPAPAHLGPSLLRFTALPLAGRLRVARIVSRIRSLDLDDGSLDDRSLGDWLRSQGERPEAIDGFWDLLIRPTLNCPAGDASLALAVKVLQTGFLESADGADVGFAAVPLDALHAEPASRVLARGGGRVCLRSPVAALEAATATCGPAVWVRGERVLADAVILASPHAVAADLLPPDAKVDAAALRSLGRSPIVNLHVVFDRPVTDHAFFAGLGTPLQWVFDRSQAAGLAEGQYLTVSLSAAGAWDGWSRERLQDVFVPAFGALLPRARAARVLHFSVTREPDATFLQVPGTRRRRPGADVGCPGIRLAGAWTDTGWPATMEGAVRSGVTAARQALNELGRTR